MKCLEKKLGEKTQQLEEKTQQLKEALKKIERFEEKQVEVMWSAEENEGELILDEASFPTVVTTHDRVPKASSLPAILPVDPEEPGDDGRAPTPAPKKQRLMKEVKALGIGPKWKPKIGQRQR